MKEDLIEPERIRAIQESLRGFLLDEVINRKGEFYLDQKISVGRLDRNNRGGVTTAGATMTTTSIILVFYTCRKKTNHYGYM